ncbi:MAG: amidohydrolase family protein [Acidobacteriia bacterium]|nr:amidohydrolase family protein [Terriglobia bacterium]
MRILLAAFLACSAYAQTRPVVITAARMIDGISDRVITPGLVVAFGGKIRPASEAPRDAETIDLGDATILPGFIDAHTHLTLPYEADYRNFQLSTIEKNVAERALDAAAIARITLLAGFTSVRDVGAHDFVDAGLRNAIRNGKVPGPRMLVSTSAIGATGGHCDDLSGYAYNTFGRESGIADGVANGPDQMRAAVRFAIKYGADVIKTCATGGVLSLTDDVDTPQLTQAELDALVDEAHSLRRKTAAHAHGAEGAKRAIRAGIDSIEHGSFLDDEALELMKTKGTYYVPTLMAAVGLREALEKGYFPPAVAAKARSAAASLDNTVRKAIAKQVKIAVGTDAGVYPHGRNAGEFVELVRLGMKPMDAIKAGTSIDAQLLGISQITGSLEPNKSADIVVVSGNPLDDIKSVQNVIFVMKEGIVYKNDSRR